jgi:hypothetical protein
MKTVNDSTVFNGVVVSPDREVSRAGEGAAVQLENGNIFFAYSRFSENMRDDAPADISSMEYDIRTGTWKDRGVVFERSDSMNLMSCSILRLNDGSLALAYIEKITPNHDHLWIAFSSDDAESWSEPVRITPEKHEDYYVANNDRLVQTKTGRLILPVAFYPKKLEGKSLNGVFYSDDNGKSWNFSKTIKILSGNLIEPVNLKDEYRGTWAKLMEDGICNQEPGVVELSDGRLMMWCRTYGGYMYKSFSEDNGESWSEYQADRHIISPCGPQSIKMIPGTSRLLCIYNDHSKYNFAELPRWHWRTPLTAAVSDDNGESWNILGELEDESHNYCYTSILFFGENVLFTYYISQNKKEGGEEKRFNLHSLKAMIVKKEAFI